MIIGDREPAYQDLTSSGSGTVSLTISHRSWRHILLSALASPCRKTIKLSGWYATTKSSPSRLIDTCLRKRVLFRNASTVSSTDITPPHMPREAARNRTRDRPNSFRQASARMRRRTGSMSTPFLTNSTAHGETSAATTRLTGCYTCDTRAIRPAAEIFGWRDLSATVRSTALIFFKRSTNVRDKNRPMLPSLTHEPS